jgi:hypothetical protein
MRLRRLYVEQDQEGRAAVEASVTKVPPSAGWLGAFGAAPFVGLAGAVLFLDGASRMLAAHALVAYGATILSFLGGVHWGLAIGSQGAPHGGNLAARLTLSVIPSLVGWAALLSAEKTGLFLLAAAIAAMLGVDIWATRAGQAPPWYPKLRLPLSCVVVATLLLAATLQTT